MKGSSAEFVAIVLVISILSCKENPAQYSKIQEPSSVINLKNQTVPVDSISAFIDQKMTEMEIPGLSFIIINDGEVAYYAVKGYANLEEKIPVDKGTLFEGASLSKPLFAYTVMYLVEEGRLDLDRPLYEYLNPNLQSNYNFDERYKQITARMVLSHTTGFPNWRGNSELIIKFDPGTDFSYSGEAYQFLVRCVESILNTDYIGLEAYFQKQVAVPLDMKYTKFVQDKFDLKNNALPYDRGERLAHRFSPDQEFNAASAVHTEAVDFSKWVIALMDQKGLSAESYYQLFSDQITVSEAPTMLTEEGAIAWTLGFAKYKSAGHFVYGHEGNNDGFNCLFLFDRDKKWGMLQFNNANEVYDFGFDLFDYINLYP